MQASGSASQLADEAVSILESISDGFFSVNRDWEFAYINRQAERILDVDRTQIVGRSLWAVYPGLLGSAFEAVYRKAMHERAGAALTSYYPDHGKWYEVRIAPVASGLSLYFRDVTAQVKTEEALRESERSFRLLAESIPQIVWIVEASGRAVYFNHRWDDYTGVPIDSSTPLDVAGQFVHADDQAITMAAWAEAYRQHGGFYVEHRIRSKTGHYRWFLVRAQPYLNAAGEIERWFGTSTDIHDEKLAQMALQAAERRQAFQLALADRLRPLTDPGEVIALVSALLGELLGCGRVVYAEVDETAGLLSLQPDWTDGAMAPMGGMRLTLDDFGPAVADVVRDGSKLVVDDVLDDPASSPYAEAYLAAGIRAVLAVPLMKEGRLRAILNIHHGQARHWTHEEIAMAEDVVDRTWFAVEGVRAQAELRAERDQSRQIFDSMAEGFGLLGSDWTILQVNEIGARLSHRAPGELTGRNLWDAMPNLAGGPVDALYRRVRQRQLPETLEHSYALTGGGLAWMEIRAYPLPEHKLAVFFRDISERKAAEERLRDADRRKDEFLAMLAHELRNPLAPIGAAAQLLRMGRLDEDRVRHTSEIIGR